ncbi:MerR family transcriptional regulator [Bacillus sp. SCS-151]|uniref:MerR family transcriptional regulator n=1 Tax=Nanhaiella sioensis TaxID=3115293 RepID=UPI003978FD1A
MKIGQFSKENKISINTTRHYIDLGLITPEKASGQYQFDEQCHRDVKDIIYLKNLGFSLSEIKTIFQYKRLGKLSALENNEFYKEIFVEKLHTIEHKIVEYEETRQNLQNELTHLNTTNKPKQLKMGMSLSVLPLLECKKCGAALSIKNGDIVNNQILHGVLQCNCEHQHFIKDGILFTPQTIHHAHHVKSPSHMMNEFNYFISDYIKETDEKYLDHLYQAVDWFYKRVNFEQLTHKILLHLGTGIGFSLRHIYNSLPKDCLYIAVDHDYQRHYVLKSILETYEEQKNILFICSDFLHIPLKKEAVDFLIDTGSSEHSFQHENFLIEEVQLYLKEESNLIGAYLTYENYHKKNEINPSYRQNFQLNNIKEKLKTLRYDLVDDMVSIPVDQSPGKYELQLLDGEKMYTYLYYGKRLG